jgi:MFS family permease
MTHSLELTFAALLVRIGLEFGADLAILGLVANAGTVTFGTTALPAGFLSDRFGPRAVISWCMFAGAAFAFLVAMAPNLVLLGAGLALLGAAIGLYHPAGTAMVSTVIERRGMAFAMHGIAGTLGVALVPAVAVGTAITTDWRFAYVVLGVAALVVGFTVRRIAPTQREAEANSRAANLAARAAPAAGKNARTTPPEPRSWLAAPLILVYVCSIGTGFIYRGSLTFLPAHLEEHLNFSLFGWSPEAVTGAMTTAVLLPALLGQFMGGYFSDRIPVERVAVPTVALTAPALMLVGATGGVVLLVCAAGFVIANFAQQPIVNSLIADYAPQGAAGKAFGISFFLTFGVGSVAASITGIVADRAGTPAAFYLLGGVATGIALVTLAIAAGAERRRTILADETTARADFAAGGR